MTCLARGDGAVVPDLGEPNGAEVSHDADLLEGDVVHVLAQQVQILQRVPETISWIWEIWLNLNIAVAPNYRVTQQVSDLGWVDFDFR